MPSWLDNLIIRTAQSGLGMQAADGSMPAGQNGPHCHRMTPTRNTSHWAITFSHAYSLSGNSAFNKAARRALDFVISPSCRPMKGAFWHRQHPARSSFNGLIGQAWTIESLYYGWKHLGDCRYRDAGLEVYQMHEFDDKVGLWWQLKLDGSPGLVERTLNQQIWFAAVGSLLSQGQHDDIEHKLDTFLDRLPSHINPRWWGLLRLGTIDRGIVPVVRREFATRLQHQAQSAALRQIESAYHVFALCGLAHLARARPRHELWRSRLVHRLLTTMAARRFQAAVLGSPFGYGYNVVGFEVPFILAAFPNSASDRVTIGPLARTWIDHQMRRHYDWQSHVLDRNTVDPSTLAARFYEIVRIPEYVWDAYEHDDFVDNAPRCWRDRIVTGDLA